MADPDEVTLNGEELDRFLEPGGTGVLSFATDPEDPPYALPVSYGYDVDHGSFYFRLAVPSESGKAPVLDRPATFVAYEQVDGEWRSVIATGVLEEVTDAPYTSTALQGIWSVEIPLVEMFERPTREVTFRYFRLVPDRITGRKESPRRQ